VVQTRPKVGVTLMEIAILLAIVFGLASLALAAWGRSVAHKVEVLAAQIGKLTTDRDDARNDASKKTEKLSQKSAELDDVKEKLRVAKLKLHEERDSTKRARELDDARADGEREAEARIRAARVELEDARSELKVANAELDTYRAGKRRPAPVIAKAEPAKELPMAEAKKVEGKAAAPEKSEPTAEEKARIETTERQLVAARRKVEELDVEVKRVRGRAETNNRVYLVAKGELEVSKDRLRTLEEKHNSLARENDVLRRALEKLQPTAAVSTEASPSQPTDTATQ
jgi:chromosome segregation ATPase